jgi:phospholipid/cholesterol/gamma-HCH transport system permease protein
MATDGKVTVYLKGRVTAHTAPPIWRSALETLARHPDRPVVIDASGLEYIDTIGVALLFDLKRQPRPSGAAVVFAALSPNLESLISQFDPAEFAVATSGRRHAGVFEHFGRSAAVLGGILWEQMSFLRRCGTAMTHALTQRQSVLWPDILDVATDVGAQAVPIVLLMGFLMGVIIAFQVGLVAREFGAVIFVVNGVGKAMLRELGALMTAIVLAGRTGAAFAAQIGTQKVNEELNALTTFGLDTIELLVIPRLLAAVVVVPLLAVLADAIGLLGGAIVMATRFDMTYLQFYSQLLRAVKAEDLMLGIAKAAVFGFTIAAIGCHRGFRTGAGPTSVGYSTTGAVVSSIVTVVAIDGVFAVLSS